MSTSVSDEVMQRLREWGVERVYAHPSRPVKSLIAAAARCDGMDVVTATSAELAALSAFASAKFTGRPGVCVAAWGRETARALEALQDASLEGRPMLVLAGAGSPPRWSRQRQEDFRSMCSGVASAGVVKVSEAAEAGAAVSESVRAAVWKGSVACVVVPRTVQESEAGAGGQEHAGVDGPVDRVDVRGGTGGPWWGAALVRAVREAVGDEALVACEWGEPSARRSADVITPSEATLYPGVPYVIAAKFAFPDRPVVAVSVGSGMAGTVAAGTGRAMQLLGSNGLVAVRRYWSEWRDPRLVVLVIDEARCDGRGRQEAGCAVEHGFSFAGYAGILGLGGERVEEAKSAAGAVARALKAGKPVVLEAPAPVIDEAAVLAELKVGEAVAGVRVPGRRLGAGGLSPAGAG